MNELAIAFKEWAVICQALADGRQTILLRKGGIAEPTGAFRVEHDRFWLFPTFVHQQDDGVLDAYRPLLDAVRHAAPPPGQVRLSHFVAVEQVWYVDRLDQALALRALHGWSDATIESRFHYRTPGLFVLAVRTYRAAADVLVPLTEHYAGCKSWVALDRPLSTAGAVPVLPDDRFAEVVRQVDATLGQG
ncbi:MAG: DUF1802 family protein [Gemmataceae bacterium]